MLTAAHCFYSYGNQIDGNNMYHSQFRVAYHTDKAGQHYYAASSTWGRMWYGTTYPEVYRNSDWAIIELEEPLGETQGYVGINPTDLRTQLPIYNKFQLIGYSEDGYSQTAGKDPQCSLEDAYQGVYFHNCDCAAGASGGALLDPSFNVVSHPKPPTYPPTHPFTHPPIPSRSVSTPRTSCPTPSRCFGPRTTTPHTPTLPSLPFSLCPPTRTS